MVDKIVYVALDYDTQEKNVSFARQLTERVSSNSFGFKINLDSVADFSKDALNPYTMVSQIRDLGKRVFVDMKMWNGGRTMEHIAQGCAALGVDIVNAYAHAGPNFLGRIKSALSGSSTKLFGLTVLTHYTDADTHELYGKNMDEAVRVFARRAYGNVDGLIVPGNQLEAIKDINVLKLCPGIRPTWFKDTRANDQEQTVTPAEAIRNGADYLVIGSPIWKSKDPAEALEKILTEVNQ